MDAQPGSDGIMAEINITPFTDVLLVLLIVFMLLAALVAPPGFEQRSGGGGDIARARTVPPISILVDARGAVTVDGVRVSERELYRALGNAVRRRGHVPVAIAADAGAPYRLILRILDAAKIAGSRDVGFIAR